MSIVNSAALSSSVFLLNRQYVAIHVVDVRRAFILLFRRLAEDVRRHLASLGATSLADVIGRADLLRPRDLSHPLAGDLQEMLAGSVARRRHQGYRPLPLPDLALRISEDCAQTMTGGPPVVLSYPVTNADRSIGARLSGEITRLHGDEGLSPGSIGAFHSR